MCVLCLTPDSPLFSPYMAVESSTVWPEVSTAESSREGKDAAHPPHTHTHTHTHTQRTSFTSLQQLDIESSSSLNPHIYTPSLHHSITPSLHHSITPSLHHSLSSITPSLHLSLFSICCQSPQCLCTLMIYLHLLCLTHTHTHSHTLTHTHSHTLTHTQS